ncbi:ERG4/ERG24 ergosterol biosynthesis protein [Schizophyllum amplum]|uniref:Delta(14)-sterol reductase ERG24 n=1 Tax=Schizophyllum amplum TaxID=97359 RepID=A0A550CHU4_9AGAR|nr:ERG4/ERG24 ergosterol biosynthesis protein [Auriculariopsis ampla]
MSKTPTQDVAVRNLNPRTTQYEFAGPLGALFVTVIVPIVTYALYFGCSEQSGGCFLEDTSRCFFQSCGDGPDSSWMNNWATISALVKRDLTSPDWWKGLWDTEAAIAYAAWYAFCVVCWAVVPGEQVQGAQMRNGQTKTYKINALPTAMLALGLTFGYIFQNGPEKFTFIYHHWVGLVTSALLMSVVQALYVYAASFAKGKLLAEGGNSGNFIYDFFIGRELNPSIGSFDIKSFNELRPGLILWMLIDISMVCEQAVRRGGFSQVTDSMWLVLGFHCWYVMDSLYNEPAIFTTMDITTDGFGFMLAVGDLAWVPFAYSLQARYLAFRHVELGYFWTAAILGTNLLGYYIFRSANGEKNNFKNDQDTKNLKYFTTSTGRKLITSGWWGWSRHPNYFGDWLMSVAWSLPTGFATPMTYFYPIYFAVLLVHRQLRDDEACHKKYGKDWEAYKKLVPYRIVRYLY